MGLNLAAVQLVRLRARTDHPCRCDLCWLIVVSSDLMLSSVLYLKLTCNMALSCRTTSSTPGCMSWLALVRIQSFAWLHSDCCSIDLCQGCCLRRLRPGLRCLLVVARCLSFRKGRTLNHGGWWKGTYSLLVCVPWHLHREHLGFVSGCSCLMDSGIFCRWAFAKF